MWVGEASSHRPEVADSFEPGVALVCVACDPLRKVVFVELDGVTVDAGVGILVLLIVAMSLLA